MKIFCNFFTVNISKLHFWLVICIAKYFIWTTLKVIFSIFRFFCTLRFQIYKYCPIITNHTSMERLFMMYTVVVKIIRTQFKSVIYIFCCTVSVGNISLHYILPLILLLISWSIWSDMKKQNKLRLNPEELCLKTLQETSCKAPEKLCSSAPRTKPALNTKMLTTNADFI